MTMPQVFKRREPLLPHAVNLDDLEQELRGMPAEIKDYVPKRRQADDIDRAVQAIMTFSALPTTQLDDAISGLKEELAKLELMAQNLRNAYVDASGRLLRYIERQKAVHAITTTAFTAMRDQCTALDQPELPLEPPSAQAATEEPTPGAA